MSRYRDARDAIDRAEAYAGEHCGPDTYAIVLGLNAIAEALLVDD